MKGILLLADKGKGGAKLPMSKGDDSAEEAEESPAKVLADMLGVDDADALVRALKAALRGDSTEEAD